MAWDNDAGKEELGCAAIILAAGIAIALVLWVLGTFGIIG